MKILKVIIFVALLGYGTTVLAMQKELGININLTHKLNREEVDKIKARAETENLDDLKNDIKKLNDHGNNKAAGHMQVVYDRRKEKQASEEKRKREQEEAVRKKQEEEDAARRKQQEDLAKSANSNAFIVSFNNQAESSWVSGITVEQVDESGKLPQTRLNPGITTVTLVEGAHYKFSAQSLSPRVNVVKINPAGFIAYKATTVYTLVQAQHPALGILVRWEVSAAEQKHSEEQAKLAEQNRQHEEEIARQKQKQDEEAAEQKLQQDLVNAKTAGIPAFVASIYVPNIPNAFVNITIEQVDETGKLPKTTLRAGTTTKLMFIDGAKYTFWGQIQPKSDKYYIRAQNLEFLPASITASKDNTHYDLAGNGVKMRVLSENYSPADLAQIAAQKEEEEKQNQAKEAEAAEWRKNNFTGDAF